MTPRNFQKVGNEMSDIVRKSLSWLLSALFALSVAAFAVGRAAGNANAAGETAGSDYVIQAAGHADSEIAITLTNRIEAASVCCVMAAYSETGRMLTINAENFTLEPTREARMALAVPEEADSVKAFVLDASTLSPLRPAWEWENAASEPAGNVLVSYFSATGSTKRIAEQIAGILDADLYEITPAVPYTSADLNYGDRSTRATVEQNDSAARPAISGTVADMAKYNAVFLGYPIWWGQAPRIISTFLESYDFTGKTVIPFCTSGSSPIGSSATNLQPLASGAAWEAGRRFAAGSSRDSIEEWMNGLNLPANGESDAPKVYFTSDISPQGLIKAYQALNWTPTGKTAVKLSTGEPPNSNYLRPELIADLVKAVDGTIVECNTAYGGSRASTALHKQVAADHGFTAIADFDLMDEDGEKSLPLEGGVRLNRAIVGSHIDDYDSFLILSHFKGHAMAGFGGAIKNVAIGMSSASGKVLVHTAGERTSGSIWYSNQDAWLEALPEMVKAVREYVGAENIVYVSVMNRLSVDCDCDGNPAEPDMHDIGILASYDPVALDQACVDLAYAAPDGASLVARMERQHGIHALEHGEEIGLGNRTYELVNLDG